MIAVPQTIFIHSLGRNFRDYLPDAFLPRCYPIRAMLDAGIPVALSSDAPVVENDNPLMGMQAAVTRRDREGHRIAPEQAITVREALDGYTHCRCPARTTWRWMPIALADGELSSTTAALSVPYRHADTRGMLRFDRNDLLALCRESHDAG